MDNLLTWCARALAKLAARNDPNLLPNDPDAARRWSVILKAYEILVDVDKRRFFDFHGKLPPELQDMDISKLNLGYR